MPRAGKVDVTSGVGVAVSNMMGAAAVSGAVAAPALTIVLDLAADADTHGWQNPYDSDAVITSAVIVVETADAGETIDVGIAADASTSSDNLLDGASVAAVGAVDTAGTNGGINRLLAKRGGANDHVTFTASAGTDTLDGKLVITLAFANV